MTYAYHMHYADGGISLPYEHFAIFLAHITERINADEQYGLVDYVCGYSVTRLEGPYRIPSLVTP